MLPACRPKSGARVNADASVTDVPDKQSKPGLPPEPAPPAADKASEAPDLEAKLTADKAYQAVWTGPRPDLDNFLSWVSIAVATSSPPKMLGDLLRAKKLFDPGIKVIMFFMRTGKVPSDFATKLAAHLEAIKSEANHGTWSTFTKGSKAYHDYTALAAWYRADDPSYLRDHIAAMQDGAGPFGFGWAGKDAAPRPWLVYEVPALERLAILTKLTPEEDARLSFLRAEAKKPRQPKLGEEFRLGGFTYSVKSVDVAESVGTGFAKKNASDGARFVLVHFIIRNDGDATETVLTDDFRIVDAKNKEYRPSSEANAALAMSGGRGLSLTELQPGLKKEITTGFEMPEDAAKGVFTLVIPEKGFLGTGSVRITLK